MTNLLDIAILSNTLVTIGLFVLTYYRVKIEREHIIAVIKNTEAREKIKKMRKLILAEKDAILKMSGKEVYEFLWEEFG